MVVRSGQNSRGKEQHLSCIPTTWIKIMIPMKKTNYTLIKIWHHCLSSPMALMQHIASWNSIHQSIWWIDPTTLFEPFRRFTALSDLGTHHGAQRYDGKSFTTLHHGGRRCQQVCSHSISAFCEVWWCRSNTVEILFKGEQDRVPIASMEGENAREYDNLMVHGVIHDEQKPGTSGSPPGR